ncbi:DUF1631 domain-containing protein [Aliikangiella maris]|uniref:DUF1631 domain-containing protein n=2 Tax=Aliikangiella maris TaxID=3162458 RepID=A0ABV2BTW8_9GAMM
MGNKSHILDFSSKSKSVAAKRKVSRPLPVLVEKARSICCQALDKSLQGMFEQADDCLFDMSDSGYNNAHFDAMRMLRMKKDRIIRNFHEQIEHSFSQNLGKIQHSEDLYGDDSLSFENIALVDDSDLEEGIAIDSIVKKARNTNNEALEQIRTRLDTIVTSHSVTQENNPFEPAFICDAFKSATATLEMGIESLLVIYKLFERVVVVELPDVYHQVNQFFIDKGVLPELKSSRKPIQKKSSSPHHSYMERAVNDESDVHSANVEKSAGEQVLSLMQNLLAGARSSSITSVASSQSAANQSTNSQLPEIGNNELLAALTQLQLDAPQVGSGKVNIRHQLDNQLSDISSNLENTQLGQFNEDMIDIVSMLFDFILDDKNLHVEIKSILARLQIPMLKVGLVDRNFFSNKNHSARILLNEIARAGISWDPSDVEAHRMRDKIQAICEEIINNFDDDISIFEMLLDDFREFQSKIQKRADIFERRTREAEEGKAKAESARGIVNSELEKICRGRHVPEAARLLLKNVWVNVLFLERLKDNDEGWEKARKIAQLLIWSVQPVESAQGLEKLISRIPILIKNLRKGFDIVSLSPIDATHFLEELEDTHRRIIKRAQEIIEAGSKEEILRLEPAPLIPETITTHDSKAANEKIEEPQLPEPVQEKVEIHEIGFSKEQLGLPEEPAKPFQLKPASFKAIEGLRAGLWVELLIEDEAVRCKLAAKITATGKYIFVNRLGVKMAEFYTDALAAEYQKGRLKIIDDEALFDRALESVISNLRAMKADG